MTTINSGTISQPTCKKSWNPKSLEIEIGQQLIHNEKSIFYGVNEFTLIRLRAFHQHTFFSFDDTKNLEHRAPARLAPAKEILSKQAAGWCVSVRVKNVAM